MWRPGLDVGCSATEKKVTHTLAICQSSVKYYITYLKVVTARHLFTSSAYTTKNSQKGTLLLLLLRLFVSSGLLNNSLPCFSIHGRLTPILNHFSQIRSDLNLLSEPRSTHPYYNSLHSVTLSTVLPLSTLTTCLTVTLQCIYFGLFPHFQQ
jgi:hypothetical protein